MRLYFPTIFIFAIAFCSQAVFGQVPAPPIPVDVKPSILKDVGIDQKLGAMVHGDLAFKDEAGRDVRLGDYFGKRPLVLVLVYFQCPMLCTMVLNDVLRTTRAMSENVGSDFDIVTVSFDPTDTPQLAKLKKETYLAQYNRPGGEAGWHFLVGKQESITALTKAVGFRYAWDPKFNVFAHASGIMVLTPDGKISRYFYGVDYAPQDLRLSLVEASGGKTGGLADEVLLYCFHYDPATGKYGLAINRALKAGGGLTVVMIGSGILLMLRRGAQAFCDQEIGASMETTFRLFPHEASDLAPRVDHLYFFLIGVSAFFVLVIFGLIVIFAIKYRRRDPNEIPPKVASSNALEIAWTVIPFLLTIVMFVWGAEIFVSAQRPPPDAMDIFVIGKQWMWQVQHPEGRKEINTLHVPLGKPIKLTLTSQDVIHDFSIPDFRVKQDVRPGSYSTEWFIPTEVGEYRLFCDQYCGAKHAEMVGTVIVCDPAQYERWLAGAQSDVPPRVAGQKLFALYGCVNCHGQYAPTLAGLYGRPVNVIDDQGNRRTVIADEAYLRESILYPNAKLVVGYPNRMPSFKSSLSEEQLMELLAYIESLTGSADLGNYSGSAMGPATEPSSNPPAIGNPPFAPYRTNR